MVVCKSSHLLQDKRLSAPELESREPLNLGRKEVAERPVPAGVVL